MIIPEVDIFLTFMVFTRVGALIYMIPMFGGRLVPTRFQLGLSGGIALIVYPLLYEANVVIPTHVIEIILTMAKELFIGLLLGFAVRIVFFIGEFAGMIIATETSTMRSEVFDPVMQTQASSISIAFFYLIALIILISGMHYKIIEVFVLSYDKVPIGAHFPVFKGIESLVKATADIFLIGLKIAAPAIGLAFVINVAFAILGKVVSKMNVFIVSFAVKIMAGLALFLMAIGLFVQYFNAYINNIPGRMIAFLSF